MVLIETSQELHVLSKGRMMGDAVVGARYGVAFIGAAGGDRRRRRGAAAQAGKGWEPRLTPWSNGNGREVEEGD